MDKNGPEEKRVPSDYRGYVEAKDRTTGLLRCRKLSAYYLPNIEIFGTIDPFVELTYLGMSLLYQRMVRKRSYFFIPEAELFQR